MIDDALAGVRSMLAADGGALELVGVDPETSAVRLRLVLEGAECRECVLPRPMLEQIVTDALRTVVPDAGTVSISDPREREGDEGG